MLADTTFLVDFLRGKKKAIRLMNEIEKLTIFTTEINVFELITGAHISKRNLKEHLDKISAMLSKMAVLQLDRHSSIKAGELTGNLILKGERIEETDCLIAGIALANGVNQIITENKKHFERIPGVKVITY